MARFKKCAEPAQAPSTEAEAEHPGRKSFVAFIRHVRPSVKITKQIRLLAAKVEPALVRQEHWLRLILVWPPRTGKTTAGSVLLLAWIFGLYPEWEAIVGSLSGKLATKIGAKVRGIIGCDKYQDVFPGVMLSKHTNSKTEFAVVNSKNEREGYFFASGRNTRATGQGAGVLFLDDIIGEKETDSVAAIEDAREAIQMWRSRGAPDGFHWIICNTRYREDDPIGFVLAEYQSDGPWDMVVLPVIIERGEEKEYILDDGSVWQREEDDVLWKYTLKTIKALQEGLMRRAPHEWFGQYKGLPRPPGGRKVNPADIMRYAEAVSAVRTRCDRVTVVVDTAKRDQDQNDPSAILCIGQIGERHYVLDALVERLLLPFLEVALARFCLLWKPHKCLVELTANGEALRDGLEKRGYAIDTSKSPHEKVPWRTPIEGVEVAGQGSKVLRFEAVVPGAVKRGALWVPESAPWAAAFVSELANFPKGHNDQCDCVAMYYKWADDNEVSLYNARPPIPAAVLAAASPAGGINRSGVGPFGHSKRW